MRYEANPQEIMAEEWLNRNYNDMKKLEADRRMLEVMENRLGAGVAKYENDGTQSHDATRSQARHEDALLEYSTQRAKVEAETDELAREMAKTRAAIDALGDPDLIAIAIDRYINQLRWKDVAKLEHIGRATVFRYRKKMLASMVEILRQKNII